MSATSLNISLLQPCGFSTIEQNVSYLQSIASEMPTDTDMLSLPECANIVQRDPQKGREEWRLEAEDPYLYSCQQIAKNNNIWVHIGSLVIQDPTSEKAFNRGYMINNVGEIVARYDKCHLFDVHLPDGSVYKESDSFVAGKQIVTADTPWGRCGMSVCFDLRFPKLYQAFSAHEATIILIPAAFTVPTGKAHWEPLLRARAIETQSVVIAAAQVGAHEDGRQTYGHSMVISPWGEVLLDAGDQPGIHSVSVDLSQIKKVREAMPLIEQTFNN